MQFVPTLGKEMSEDRSDDFSEAIEPGGTGSLELEDTDTLWQVLSYTFT